MIRSTLTFCSLSIALLFACSSSSDDSSGSDASADAISACKEGCDKMKFFDCSSAAELAACHDDCDAASSKQIETFTACAENSICDPECRLQIAPKPEDGDDGPPKGSGASESSCQSACQKLVTCNFIRVGDEDPCVAACQKEAYQFQIDCVNGNECSKLKDACGADVETDSPTGDADAGGTSDPFSEQRCKNACDSAKLFDCFDAAQHGECQDKCSAADETARDQYTSCVDTSGSECSELDDCYSQLP